MACDDSLRRSKSYGGQAARTGKEKFIFLKNKAFGFNTIIVLLIFFIASPMKACSLSDVKEECQSLAIRKLCDDDCRSHSYLKPRSITTNNVFQHNLGLYWWYHDVLCEENCIWWAMQVMPLYQRSTDAKAIAEYFFPCHKSAISIKEDGTGDVGSLWLNLIAQNGQSFDSTVSMRPVRSVSGVYVDFRFDFSTIICHSWVDIALAVLHAKHTLHFCQTLSQYPGIACDVSSAGQALSQESWCYGKFKTCSGLTTHGVDDVQLKLGYDWFYCDTNHISPYIVGIVPTAERGSSEFIFEPSVGSNHASIGVGVLGDYKMWLDDFKELTLLTDFKYRYVLRATDTRSFDLCKNGDWSRYLQIVQECAPSNSLPGINFLTQEVQVIPGSTIDWWLAIHYQQNQLNLELGYDFWWRREERIKLCESFPSDWGIYDIAGDCNRNPVTASTAHICQSVVNNVPSSDATFTALTATDLDLASGAAPRAISNTVYLAVAYNGYLCDSPAFIGFGGSYESGNQILSNWALWIRCAVAF
jgi:hypothetical protein